MMVFNSTNSYLAIYKAYNQASQHRPTKKLWAGLASLAVAGGVNFPGRI